MPCRGGTAMAVSHWVRLPLDRRRHPAPAPRGESRGCWVWRTARRCADAVGGIRNLQGVWNNSTSTPLERLTEAEIERGRLARQPVIEATRGTGAGWSERAGDLERESLVIDPPDGRIPSLLPAAKQRLIDRENAREGRGEGDSWLDRNSWERCITRTMPVTMIPNAYNANYQILQTPDHVVIQIEMIHESRIIPLDGRPHVADGVRQWLGTAGADG